MYAEFEDTIPNLDYRVLKQRKTPNNLTH